MHTSPRPATRSLVLALAIFAFVGCAAFAADGPVGTWNISVDAQGQLTEAVLIIVEEDGKYSGKQVYQGEQELSDISYKDGKLSFKLDIPEAGITASFEGTINGNSLEGKYILADFGIEMITTGTRGAKVVSLTELIEKAAEEMQDTTDKVVLGSVEWVNLARTVLEELVAEHGEEGKSFSACEVFTDAPEGLAGPDPTTVAWHFRIDGKTVTVGEGEIEGADLNVRAAYALVLPAAKMVYTPEMIAAARASRPEAEAEENAAPEYLVELHNRLAVLTK